MTNAGGPLSGIVVLDLSRALAGPHAAMLLGDLGARVIKVEQPGTGDDTRGWGPPFVGPDDEPISTYFLSCNRNKESVELDLKSDDGREQLTRLVRASDVLVENFRPGVLDRLGFSMERLHELNPRLVICSISGFGHDGPEGGRAGYDQIAQGEAGLMSITGPSQEEPTKVGVPIGDLLAGLHGAYGTLSALYERERTGEGRVVRTSLLSSIVGVHAFQGTRWTVAGEVPRPIGNHHPSIAPYGAYSCADGMLQVAVASEGQWAKFAGLLGIDAADPRFARNADRVANRPDLNAEIEAVLATAPRDTWLARIGEVGIPCGAIRTVDQVYEWDQTRSQGLLLTVDHPVLGAIDLPGPAVRFDARSQEGAEGAAGRSEHLPPPTLGEHNDSVRAWLDELDARG
ncbi:crotonobetainyl-CoA:carnitine CoA-transferase CaiB-like acyl-CoA transferase [Spinactinospora alkalitolerans]|uniref:Crotonobetainyl-CoA:carnitine CoA-transferase CaiB-like acyl-CoA transferase n=1 Tax=Spinactinospora alkalitolerans TaxID=687207 RepID=A0A852TZB4_9ACTN|nr:CoA transferase [Spinactinospora alkalitolerans]NYE48647.1 crotonobetainyl-CoA:carnitine CoA-transferase CaiB-like acyl-CoA transferase [Spinactinospora alkalitolerans]